jgi:anti-anti-sigma factor
MKKLRGFFERKKISIPERRADSEACSVHLRDSPGPAVVLDVSGCLTAECEGPLSQAFTNASAKSKKIILNLSGLPHIDPEGVTLLLINTVRAARKKVFVAACGVTEPLKEVFRLTRLDKAIGIVHAEKEVVCAASPDRRLSCPEAPRDHGSTMPGWAKAVQHVSAKGIPRTAMNINVHGRRIASPVEGFGQLWDKKYRLRIPTLQIPPEEIISLWKSDFETFLPRGNHLYLPGGCGIAPGITAVLNLRLPGGLVMAAGFMVMYGNDISFSFMAVQGHVVSGWITFRAFRENSGTAVQVHATFRTSDPLMELAFRMHAAKQEDRFWRETLANIGRRLGGHGKIEQQTNLVDPRLQWDKMEALWYNDAIRSFLYIPIYLVRRFRSRREN